MLTSFCTGGVLFRADGLALPLLVVGEAFPLSASIGLALVGFFHKVGKIYGWLPTVGGNIDFSPQLLPSWGDVFIIGLIRKGLSCSSRISNFPQHSNIGSYSMVAESYVVQMLHKLG
jgi:hypothetical protein